MGGRALLRGLAVAVLLAHPTYAASDAELLNLVRAASEQDTECSDGPFVSRDACVGKSAGCMWLQFDKKNLCLPCQWGMVEVPCAPTGALFPSGRVKRCDMGCAHQQVITKVSACTDVSGDISVADCRNKGASSMVQCMWTAYKTKEGSEKTMCGPCMLDGSGKIPPYLPGGVGPEPGSRVTGSSSMCEDAADSFGLPCDPANGIPAITPCRPTPAPTLPGGLPLPVPLASLGLRTSDAAPEYVAVPVAAPYSETEFQTAATAAARVAGWPVGSALPPTARVAMYGYAPVEGPQLPGSMKAVYQPPPPGILDIPSAPGIGTAPPTALLDLSSGIAPVRAEAGKASRLLRALRRRVLSQNT